MFTNINSNYIYNIIEYFSFVNYTLLFLFITIILFFLLLTSTTLTIHTIKSSSTIIEFISSVTAWFILVVIISPALVILYDAEYTIIPSYAIFTLGLQWAWQFHITFLPSLDCISAYCDHYVISSVCAYASHMDSSSCNNSGDAGYSELCCDAHDLQCNYSWTIMDLHLLNINESISSLTSYYFSSIDISLLLKYGLWTYRTMTQFMTEQYGHLELGINSLNYYYLSLLYTTYDNVSNMLNKYVCHSNFNYSNYSLCFIKCVTISNMSSWATMFQSWININEPVSWSTTYNNTLYDMSIGMYGLSFLSLCNYISILLSYHNASNMYYYLLDYLKCIYPYMIVSSVVCTVDYTGIINGISNISSPNVLYVPNEYMRGSEFRLWIFMNDYLSWCPGFDEHLTYHFQWILNNAYRQISSNRICTYSNYLVYISSLLLIPIYSWIRFYVISYDVIHTIGMYSLGIKIDCIPGRVNVANTIRLLHKGECLGKCFELCGQGHMNMYIHAIIF